MRGKRHASLGWLSLWRDRKHISLRNLIRLWRIRCNNPAPSNRNRRIVLVAAFSVAFLSEKLAAVNWLGIVLIASGALLVAYKG